MPSFLMTETLVLIVTIAVFITPIVFTSINPFPFQKIAAQDAKRRGWGDTIIRVTRSCEFLTLYSQFWTIVAMYYLTPTTMFIAQSLSWSVFIVYHSMNYISPALLSYHPREFVQEVVRWTPPRQTKYFGIWLGLHLQHTVSPLYLHYLTQKHNIDYTNNLFAFVSAFNAVLFYIGWHLFCWHVQGIPAYPFLTEQRINMVEHNLYCVGLSCVVALNCVLAGMWRELGFYLLGFGSVIAVVFVADVTDELTPPGGMEFGLITKLKYCFAFFTCFRKLQSATLDAISPIAEVPQFETWPTAADFYPIFSETFGAQSAQPAYTEIDRLREQYRREVVDNDRYLVIMLKDEGGVRSHSVVSTQEEVKTLTAGKKHWRVYGRVYGRYDFKRYPHVSGGRALASRESVFEPRTPEAPIGDYLTSSKD